MALGIITGALGQLADVNITAVSTLSGGAWSPALPLDNILANATADAPRHIGAPARCANPTNLAASQLEVTFDRAYGVSLLGLLFHTLSLTARYRVIVAGSDGDLDAPVFVSEWQDVYGRLFDSFTLPFETPNWLSGQVSPADLDLYPRHLWTPLGFDGADFRVTKAVRYEFDDQDNTAGYFDVGNVFVASSFTPQMNFDRGRQLGAKSRDVVEEGPSGRLFPRRGRARRTHNVSWSGLSKADAWALYDMGLRAGTTRPVLFVPDIGDPIALQREAFPATFVTLNEPRFVQDQQHVVTAQLQEMIT